MTTGFEVAGNGVRAAARARIAIVFVAATLFLTARVAGAVERPLKGLPLSTAISRVVADGVPVLYSSALVTPNLRVQSEPSATQPRLVLAELLAAHDLSARSMTGGRLVVVRAPPKPAVAPRPAAPATPEAPLPEIIVAGSRYAFLRQPDPEISTLSAEDLESLPALGDDPLRAIARLPGTATNSLSAKSSIRGGEVDETLVRFDGLRLFNPFHLKDFQSVFSAVDPALVRELEVYTGGFPVDLGDRMSGVIDIAPLAVQDEPLRVLSAGFFSAGLLATDRFGDNGDWLVAGRRGNLDLVLDALNQDRGKPRYFDTHARIGYLLDAGWYLRANVLHFEDRIDVFDSDQEERARASYRDTYLWTSADYRGSSRWSGRVMAARADIRGRRAGTATQPGISVGSLAETRDTDVTMLQSDWSLTLSDRTTIDFGGEWRHARGDYRYAEDVTFDLLFDVPGAPTENTRNRTLAATPSGRHASLYSGVRLKLSETLALDAGLRLDVDSLPAATDRDVSPRLALAWDATPDTRLRVSWGRFVQSQGVDELQISDGLTSYARAQRADHLVLSLRQDFGDGWQFRGEVYEKRYRHLRPRFENILNAYVILPELKPDRLQIDASRATARGVEMFLTRDAPGPVDYWLNYSWSTVRDDIGSQQVPRLWDQSHAFGGGLLWKTAAWDVSLAASWRSGWPTTRIELASTDPQPTATIGTRNGERLPDYASVDFRVARMFAFERSSLTAYLELTNLTNRRNDCCVEYEYNTENEDMPFLETERSRSLPFVPNLGFTWQF